MGSEVLREIYREGGKEQGEQSSQGVKLEKRKERLLSTYKENHTPRGCEGGGEVENLRPRLGKKEKIT